MRNIVILNSLHFSYPLPILMRVSYNTLIVKQNTSDYYKYNKRYSISFIVNCTFYCISAKYLSLQAKTFAPFLHLFQLYPLIEFAKQLPEPIGYIFLIDD